MNTKCYLISYHAWENDERINYYKAKQEQQKSES